MKADDPLLKRFLVNAVGPDERQQIERQLITDEVFAEELMALEDELILAYARGELTGEERDRFETTLAGSPSRQRRLGKTRDLLGALQAHAAAAPSPPADRFGGARQWLAMAATLAVLAVAGLVVLNRSGTPPAPPVAAPDPAPRTVTLRLQSGATRSDLSQGNLANLAGVDQVRLVGVWPSLPPGAERASIRAVGGGDLRVSTLPVFSTDGSRRVIDWTIPRAALPAGDYILTVEMAADGGRTTLASWFFSIVS
jgi:hypothetical protein